MALEAVGQAVEGGTGLRPRVPCGQRTCPSLDVYQLSRLQERVEQLTHSLSTVREENGQLQRKVETLTADHSATEDRKKQVAADGGGTGGFGTLHQRWSSATHAFPPHKPKPRGNAVVQCRPSATPLLQYKGASVCLGPVLLCTFHRMKRCGVAIDSGRPDEAGPHALCSLGPGLLPGAL